MDRLDPYVPYGKLFLDGAAYGQSQIGKATWKLFYRFNVDQTSQIGPVMDRLDTYVTDSKLFGDGAEYGQSKIGKATWKIKLVFCHFITFPTDFMLIRLTSQDLFWINLILI